MILSQQGINLIERVVLDMKCRWHPTVGVDAGIDGTIELTDQADEPHPLGLVLHVQSRATELRWPNENDTSFTYSPRQEDLDYWLRGNAPVLLIVSRPNTEEAYWVSIKDYFADAAQRRTRQVVFNKTRTAFTAASYPHLFELGREHGQVKSGLYLAPTPVAETLTVNLMPITRFGPKLFVAETPHRTREAVFTALREAGADAGGLGIFIPVGKNLISLYDLRDQPWPRVCERGTVDEFDADEWAFSADRDRQREYARLLRLALNELLYPIVRLNTEKDMYAFASFGEERARRFPFVINGRKRRPTVLQIYPWTYEGKRYVRYRHVAMQAAFRRSEQQWFIEITPTYLFTRDGREVDRRHEELLAGIKRFDHQPAVLRHLQLWEAVLRRPAGLFGTTEDHLSIGELLRVGANFGIIDRAWQEWDEAPRHADIPSDELRPEALWNN
jgi:hypothetical protein